MTMNATGSAKDRAYARIRTGILTGEFPAGSFIEEGQACALAQVSRTPVREALNRLAAEGFIEQLPRRGAMVRHVTGQELADLYEARKLLEGHAARIICDAGAGAPDVMRRLYDQMETAPVEDLLTQVELNRLFHQELMLHCGNGVLIRMAEGLSASMTRVALSALTIDAARKTIIQAEHLALIEALDAGDADAAQKVLNKHLEPLPQLLARMPR